MDCYPSRGVRATLLNFPPFSLGREGNIRCEFMFRFFHVEHPVDRNMCITGLNRIHYDSLRFISIRRTRMMDIKHPPGTVADQFTDLNLFFLGGPMMVIRKIRTH